MADGHEGGDRLSKRLAMGRWQTSLTRVAWCALDMVRVWMGTWMRVQRGLGGRERALRMLTSSPRAGRPSPEGLWISPVALTRYPGAGDRPTCGSPKSQRWWWGAFGVLCSLEQARLPTAHG